MRICFTSLLLFVGVVVHAQLSPVEKKIVQTVNEQYKQTVQLLKESVDINSGTFNSTGVKAVGELYAKELRALGFTVEWVSLPDSLQRAGHLVAYRKGTKGKKLFLIGHLDTVFEPDMPFTPFTLINDSTATGQGVNDMKGGDVIMIKALQALNAQGLLDDITITAYFTGDEERGGEPISVSRADFIERAKLADVAIGFEGATGLNTIATARRGSSDWKLEVSAQTGHSSGIFTDRAGYGAIYEAARIINEFRTALSSEQYLTFNPGLIIGGSEISYDQNKASGSAIGKDNIISPSVVVSGDLRFLTEQQKENARVKMNRIKGKLKKLLNPKGI